MERLLAPKLLINSPRPLQVAVALAVVGIALAAFAPFPALIAYFALLVSILIGLTLAVLGSIRSTEGQPRLLQLLLDLSRDREISGMHVSIAEALNQIANQHDPIFRRLALQRLQSIGDQCAVIGRATVEFTSTESWRVVYEELLRSPGLHLYRSVAHIESPHYWQDGPGQQSTKLNLELQDQGVVSIERTAIIADHLWPETSLFPIEPLHSWLDEQHRHGIWLRLVRESALGTESDLLTDFGIYGNRAVGMQSADPSGRTIRFVLSFDFDKLRQAETQWSRLAVYAISYRELLDQKH
ncbi:MAG: hypothetical protein KDA96_13965 [Planctomycetaceae bacterium]|nr:hypothetical protein [Planctomycetaceae bacterium]